MPCAGTHIQNSTEATLPSGCPESYRHISHLSSCLRRLMSLEESHSAIVSLPPASIRLRHRPRFPSFIWGSRIITSPLQRPTFSSRLDYFRSVEVAVALLRFASPRYTLDSIPPSCCAQSHGTWLSHQYSPSNTPFDPKDVVRSITRTTIIHQTLKIRLHSGECPHAQHHGYSLVSGLQPWLRGSLLPGSVDYTQALDAHSVGTNNKANALGRRLFPFLVSESPASPSSLFPPESGRLFYPNLILTTMAKTVPPSSGCLFRQ